MEGPRAPAETEYKDVVQFLDSSLRPNANWSIVSEYPTALNQQNLHNIRIIKEGGEVLAHAVMKPLIVKTPIAIFRVGAIGSVVTNSSYRNQGLSRQIIESCLNEAEKQECDFAVLWTNLFDFYRKFGFELSGSEVSLVFEKPFETPEQKLTIREGANVDPAALHRLFARHTVNTVRTIEEIRQYLKIPNSRVFTAWDSTGTLQGYAIEGKGADLDGYIHEWGGGVNEILALVNHILKKQNRPITLIAPSHSINLIHRSRDLGCESHEGFLGMIKIVNPTSLFGKISRHVKNDYGIKNFVLEKQGADYVVGVGASTLRTASEAEMVRFLFGPTRPSDLHKFDTKAVDILNQVFPLRLWFWGWDSV